MTSIMAAHEMDVAPSGWEPPTSTGYAANTTYSEVLILTLQRQKQMATQSVYWHHDFLAASSRAPLLCSIGEIKGY